MRRALMVPFMFLAGCGAPAGDAAFNRPPGLDIAQIALANGAPSTALHVAQIALAANPRDVVALTQAGNAQAAMGQFEQASASFRQALALSLNDPDASLGLARLQLESDPAAAAAILQRLVAARPRDVPALIDLGIAHDLLGEHALAQQAYRAALVVEPACIPASVNLGLSLALSGDAAQAVAILRPLAASPLASPRMRQDLAAALVLRGDNQEAEAVLHADMPQPQVLAAMAGYRLFQSSP